MQIQENNRQARVARQIQKDLGEVLRRMTPELFPGAIVSVTAVRMSPDLGYAKVYLSVFPYDRVEAAMQAVGEAARAIRGQLGALVRNQLRVVPELSFFVDDSLEYVERIDSLLK